METDEAPAPFIVGVPRSGTTLLRLMLDAHSRLAIPAETHFLPALLRGRLRGLSTEAFLGVVIGDETWANFGLDPVRYQDTVRGLEPFTVSEALRSFYRLYAARFGKDRWGDKTPPHRRHLASIQKLLPEAHFVHLIRDGRDVALSLRELWWGPGDDVEAQARFWVEEIERTRGHARRARNYVEVRYEELVAKPEPVLRSICDYLSLPFESGMLAYHEQAGARLGEYRRPFGPPDGRPDIASFIAIHERATGPPDPSRIGRWRTELTDGERGRYEAVAGPLLRDLGYETDA